MDAEVRGWLEEVADPEIPALSVVDLGIVRGAAWHGEELEVTITPTYSGCPAMAAIECDIEAALRAHGVERVRLTRQLAPAWTTEWITRRGREKLREFGVTPPGVASPLTDIAPQVECPLCGSRDTECISAFGSTACKALYRCRACREPFDYFKPLT
ncbi:MAG: 1,2-phenylacetyl-CoA epoxidase subunit PaaD [Terriglobales bacterium]